MTAKPSPMEPLINIPQSDAVRFGQVSPNAWRISGNTMTIDEYIENQRHGVNSADLRVLANFTGRLLDKLKESNAGEHPGLIEAVCLIVQVLESPAVQRTKDPLPTWLAELGFAAGYLLKRFDLIPDHVAGIGLADDALILQRVIERNKLELERSLEAESGADACD